MGSCWPRPARTRPSAAGTWGRGGIAFQRDIQGQSFLSRVSPQTARRSPSAPPIPTRPNFCPPWTAPNGRASTAIRELSAVWPSVRTAKRLATGSDDKNIRLWDVASGQTLRTLQGGHTEPVRCLAFSPDGQTLASGSTDQTVRLWEVSSDEQSRELAGHQGPIWSALFSPDGRHIVSARSRQTVKVWQTLAGKEEHALKGHRSPVTAALYSPDGKYIVSCSGDKLLKLWDSATGKEVRTFTGHTGAVTWAASVPTASSSSPGRRTVSSRCGMSIPASHCIRCGPPIGHQRRGLEP